MVLGPKRSRNRDIALATLVELLVQIVFVFTLVLVVSEAIEGPPEERGWASPDTWKTLISALDIDPNMIRDADMKRQAEAMKQRYEGVKRELDQALENLGKCEVRLSDADKGFAKCQKSLGRGPGNPVCRGSKGEEVVLLSAVVNRDGDMLVEILPAAGGIHAA